MAVRALEWTDERAAKRPRLSDEGWISPKEQCDRFYRAIVQRISDLGNTLIPAIAAIIAEYTVDEAAMYWYTALSLLETLPEKIPPLSNKIFEVLNRTCPIFGEPHRVNETHILALAVQGYAAIIHFEQHVVTVNRENPRKKDLSQFVHDYMKLVLNNPFTPSKKTHWLLFPIDVLPGSQGKTWEEQVKMIENLKQKSGMAYQAPTLHEAYTALLTEEMAQKNKVQREPIYFRVMEMEGNIHFCIRNAPLVSGLIDIQGSPIPNGYQIGIAPVLEVDF